MSSTAIRKLWAATGVLPFQCIGALRAGLSCTTESGTGQGVKGHACASSQGVTGFETTEDKALELEFLLLHGYLMIKLGIQRDTHKKLQIKLC